MLGNPFSYWPWHVARAARMRKMKHGQISSFQRLPRSCNIYRVSAGAVACA